MENSPHRLEYRIIYGDTDAGGIVYNGNYLRFLEMGRTEMMRERICSYKDVEKRGLILPVTESYLRYKAPALYDDLITIETKLVELKKVSCKFTYKIVRTEEESEKERLLTRGYTVHAAVNLQGKLTPFPEDLLASLQTMIFQKTP
jgi:acyl-CoA thioester hydrolase